MYIFSVYSEYIFYTRYISWILYIFLYTLFNVHYDHYLYILNICCMYFLMFLPHLNWFDYLFRFLGVYFVLEAVSKLVEEDWEYIPPAESYRAGLLLQQDSTDGFAFSLQLSALGKVVLVQQQDHRCRGYFPVHQPKDARAWIEQNPNCSCWDFILGSFGGALAGQEQDCLNDIATFTTLETLEYAK